MRLASLRLAPLKLASCRWAKLRSAPRRSVWVVLLALARQAFQAATPRFSRSTCAGLAMGSSCARFTITLVLRHFPCKSPIEMSLASPIEMSLGHSVVGTFGVTYDDGDPDERSGAD